MWMTLDGVHVAFNLVTEWRFLSGFYTTDQRHCRVRIYLGDPE